jgi:hypothetical protein
MIRVNEDDSQVWWIGRDGDPATSRESAGAPAANPPLEVIGGFTVHPFASRFPLIVGKDFDDLVEAIRLAGTVAPVELHEGLLIDGRNRVRAVEELRRQGVEIELPTSEWQPKGDETVEGHIFAVNMFRRHMTDDQRVALATLLLPAIRESRLNRQAATRFGAAPRATAASNSPPPSDPVDGPPRSSRDKDAASSVGQLAALCKVSQHKARQAVVLADGVASGAISPAEFDAVTGGQKRLCEIVPSRKNAGGRSAASKAPYRPAAELVFDSESDDDDDEGDARDASSPEVTEEDVRHRWDRFFKQHYAIADHCELRKIALRVIDQERRAFDRGK